MGSNIVVALGHASADGHTLFGINVDRPANEWLPFTRVAGREHCPGETVRTQHRAVPQIRTTFSVLAAQPAQWWGYTHGVNDRGVVIGATGYPAMLPRDKPGLTGGDLVRLGLERSYSARQAVDVLGGLIERHGQSASPDFAPGSHENTFLIADVREAFALEAAGDHWVCQEIREVRAVSNVCVIRQDWDRIAQGLGACAIDNGYWPADGRKLDFAGAFSRSPMGEGSGLRRWGRATLYLEQQNGHIDIPFLRRLLSDHYEGTPFEVDPQAGAPGPVPLCQHPSSSWRWSSAGSFLADLSADPGRLSINWHAFGPPCLSVYLPLFLEGELPAELTEPPEPQARVHFWRHLRAAHAWAGRDAEFLARWRDVMATLQCSLDNEAEEFASEGAALKRRGSVADLSAKAGRFMQHGLDRMLAATRELSACGLEAALHAEAALAVESRF